jgi:hypothetical protein
MFCPQNVKPLVLALEFFFQNCAAVSGEGAGALSPVLECVVELSINVHDAAPARSWTLSTDSSATLCG